MVWSESLRDTVRQLSSNTLPFDDAIQEIEIAGHRCEGAGLADMDYIRNILRHTNETLDSMIEHKK